MKVWELESMVIADREWGSTARLLPDGPVRLPGAVTVTDKPAVRIKQANNVRNSVE